jgi:threonine synthase
LSAFGETAFLDPVLKQNIFSHQPTQSTLPAYSAIILLLLCSFEINRANKGRGSFRTQWKFWQLDGGLLAKRMGLPIHKFIAATNINDVVPQYLASKSFNPRPSKQTISNAMDVGNPSNFVRMLDLFAATSKALQRKLSDMLSPI